MQHTNATILALLAIALIVFGYTGGLNIGADMNGNLGGAAVEMATVQATATTPVSLVANSGFLPAYGTITLNQDGFSFDAGTAQVLTIELRGAMSATFRVQHVIDPDTYTAYDGRALVARQGVSGGVYAALSTTNLIAMRDAQGSGWYVFTAQADTGAVRSLPLFIR